MSKLAKISHAAQDIADAIKAAFQIDVEIIDDDLVRIAATSSARKGIGQKMTYGTVTKIVLAKKKPVIIENFQNNQYCLGCPGYGQCTYFGGILVPIAAGKETIGTINLVAYDQAINHQLTENSRGLVSYLYKMGELLITKIKEEEILEREKQMSKTLNTIINSVSDGLILVDEKGFIMHINKASQRLLPQENNISLVGRNIEDILPGIPFNSLQEGLKINNIELTFGNRTRFVANLKPILVQNGSPGALIMFYPYDNLKKIASELTNSVKRITFEDIISKSNAVKKLKAEAGRFAAGNSTILITGESGTGKELFARAIHTNSQRANHPFITVNCGAIPETLIESELFGYEKGAFTGASSRGKLGKFELANQGTIFLDEIGTMPIYLQIKLLRVIQNREIERVGGTETIPIDVRIIAATNSNLEEMVRDGKFRQDLYYRLNVIPLSIPPLRSRKEDISILSYHFLEKYNKLLNKNISRIDENMIVLLENYSWPGNVRELENVIEYAVNFTLPEEKNSCRKPYPSI